MSRHNRFAQESFGYPRSVDHRDPIINHISVNAKYHMLVTVQLDLTQDERLFDLAEKDDRIIALMRVYDALGDEQYLIEIGNLLWNLSDYADQMWNICGGDIYDFAQMGAWMFEFKTSENNAVLFMTGFSSPKILRVAKPKLATRNDLKLKS